VTTAAPDLPANWRQPTSAHLPIRSCYLFIFTVTMSLLHPYFIFRIRFSQAWIAVISLSLCQHSTLRTKVSRNKPDIIGNYQPGFFSASEVAVLKVTCCISHRQYRSAKLYATYLFAGELPEVT
ncbi:hypothetical protein, partial [Pantoea agglomerans]|uniref:hypothetical protein n=1 Tax=Enterobacter agglomerans TaxID=549 RepID=UPI001D0CA101